MSVGSSTGPLTVGPMKAAPASTGAGWIKEISFSLDNTPGDINGIFSDNKIFSEIFGDYKFTTLDVGIRKMVKYHKDVN